MRSNRTLVCIQAQTRSHRLSWPSFKRNVLDVVGADLALCIGIPEDYDYSNPYWQHAKYRWTSAEYDDFGKAFDLIKIHELGDRTDPGDWRMLISIRDQWLGGINHDDSHPGSGAIVLFFRWLLLFHLKKENILQRYDRFIITRSDFIWECPHPPLEYMSDEFIWVPDGEEYGGIADRHAVLSTKNIHDYLDLTKSIIHNPLALWQRMSSKSTWNPEQFLLAELLERGYKDKIKSFPYVMYAARERGGSTRWAKGVWSPELGCYIKYISEYNSATIFRELIKSREDWIKCASKNKSLFLVTASLHHIDGSQVVFNNGRLKARCPAKLNGNDIAVKVEVRNGECYPIFPKVSRIDVRPSCIKRLKLYSNERNAFNLQCDDGGFLYVNRQNNIGKSGPLRGGWTRCLRTLKLHQFGRSYQFKLLLDSNFGSGFSGQDSQWSQKSSEATR